MSDELVETGGGELTAEDKQMAMIAQGSGLFGFIGPLIIYAIKGNESEFVKYHSMQALILQCIYLGVVLIIILPLSVCTFGLGSMLIFPLIPVVYGAHIWAAMKANEGEWFGFPGIAHIGLPDHMK